jgi:hypothetical protein
MKKIITLFIGLFTIGTLFLGCNQTSSPTTKPNLSVDTTRYTDVVLLNNSEIDSVQVFVTMASTESIVGKFGMDSTNFNPDAKNPDGSLVKCKGIFWAKKGIKYHLGDTTTLFSVVICWGVDNQACSAAQAILDSTGKQVYPYGLNIFEFTVNSWWQNGKTTGANTNYTLDVSGSANVAALHINNTKVLGEGFALPVAFGGSGLQSVTANTVLFGNGTGALGVTNAPTAGQVLQYRTDGVKFGGLDGGTF